MTFLKDKLEGGDFIIPLGTYKGKTIKYLVTNFPDYALWVESTAVEGKVCPNFMKVYDNIQKYKKEVMGDIPKEIKPELKSKKPRYLYTTLMNYINNPDMGTSELGDEMATTLASTNKENIFDNLTITRIDLNKDKNNVQFFDRTTGKEVLISESVNLKK